MCAFLTSIAYLELDWEKQRVREREEGKKKGEKEKDMATIFLENVLTEKVKHSFEKS